MLCDNCEFSRVSAELLCNEMIQALRHGPYGRGGSIPIGHRRHMYASDVKSRTKDTIVMKVFFSQNFGHLDNHT